MLLIVIALNINIFQNKQALCRKMFNEVVQALNFLQGFENVIFVGEKI